MINATYSGMVGLLLIDWALKSRTMSRVYLSGLPYFPGVAVARLHQGGEGNVADRIVLLTQDDINGNDTLPAGFIVVESIPFSHTMIGLLGKGVPTVLISAQQAALLDDGMLLMIDGSSGVITTDVHDLPPVVELLRNNEPGKPIMMADGEPVNLCASVRKPSLARRAVELGAQSIGLVRSEFLLPADNAIPDRGFYLNAFREICEAASPLSVTFRLLDVAADKMPSWISSIDSIGQLLGMQGVRIYNTEPVSHVIDAQLAALAELSSEYPLRVLVPFLVRLEEFDYWLNVIRKRLPDHVPVGAMAETPAMVLDIAHLLEDADFVAIGCNDLMQSIYAADRDQADLRHYLDPYAPLLFRLFRQIASEAGTNINRVQLCGVLSQVQAVLPVLLGMGYRTFSVDVPFIPHLASRISTMTLAECRVLAQQVCDAKKTEDVLRILQLSTDRHAPFCC
ncbi:MAG: phosphoenolpyruvate-protein phosphotransferase [Gammaproteobacteria bacterium]|nr:MAG: phosphoenolpyruvate-protein phosphotransferase [Gammaproteobacteria bacterium]